MELRHFRYFVVLAEELHFGRAAERLHISQPPLSQQIRALEAELAVELFERTSRSVALTEAGRLFLPEARATLAQADRARLVAQRAQRGELGELVIAMFPSAPLSASFSHLVARFRAAYPSALLSLTVLQTHMAVAGLKEGRFEVAVLRSDGPPPVPQGFVVTELTRERLVVAFPADHQLATTDEPMALAELRDERFVHFPAFRRNAVAYQFIALCRASGFEPDIVQEAHENGTILALVGAGIGISVLPESVCRLAMPEIRTRPLVDPAATTGAWIAWPKRPKTPLVRSLIALMAGRGEAASISG